VNDLRLVTMGAWKRRRVAWRAKEGEARAAEARVVWSRKEKTWERSSGGSELMVVGGASMVVVW
jgi:hypothetical protein